MGEWQDGKRNGHGTITTTDGGKIVGESRENNPWNFIKYDKNGKIKGKLVNGNYIKQYPPPKTNQIIPSE